MSPFGAEQPYHLGGAAPPKQIHFFKNVIDRYLCKVWMYFYEIFRNMSTNHSYSHVFNATLHEWI